MTDSLISDRRASDTKLRSQIVFSLPCPPCLPYLLRLTTTWYECFQVSYNKKPQAMRRYLSQLPEVDKPIEHSRTLLLYSVIHKLTCNTAS